MAYKLIAVMLLVSCAHAPPTLEERCTPLLQEILSIQDLRNSLSNKMGDHTKQYQMEQISKENYKLYFSKWIKTELALRDKVTALYDVAYETKCL